MGEVEFNKDEEYNVKIVGDIKEPGGANIRKPTQDEIDAYKIHRIVVMIIFGLVVVILLLLIVILIATTEGCEPMTDNSLPWYKSGVMYNLYPRSFKDSDGDGFGDFKGIVQKLGYLKGLGVNILYLSSVFKIDKEVDYGYSVIDFKATNTEYGSMKDFEKLISAAHDEGMKVIIEFVPCETSNKHEWFTDSSKETNKTDWYVWQDNATSPDDGMWSKNANGKYYLHPKNFSQKASLNWDNAAVQEELQSVLGFWLDKKVDGFRVVSVQRLFGGRNPTNDKWTKIHAIVEKWQNYTTKKSPNSILIGSSHPAELALYGTEGRPELDIVINFDLVYDSHAGSKANFYTAANFKKIITEYVQKPQIAKGNWPSWSLTSWVHGRVGSNVDGKLAKSLQALILMLPGTPVVFYGDEIGMENVNNLGKPAVDMNKAPMQWNNSKNAGFTYASSTWFGHVGNSTLANADNKDLDIKNKFKEALKLRKDNATVLLDGAIANFTIVSNGNVLAYVFKDNTQRFLSAINFGDTVGGISLKKIGVKSASLKYHTADAKPGKIKSLDDVKVPAKAFYLFLVDSWMK